MQPDSSDQLREHTYNLLEGLSQRERLVAQYFAAGLSHKLIAQRLQIAPTTVRNHISRIYRKLAIHNKAVLATLIAGGMSPLPPDSALPSQFETERATMHATLPVQPKSLVPAASADLRQLTVLACCLHDAKPSDEYSDLEARRDQVCAYQELCHQILAHYDGHIAHALEENLRIFFGYPRAHEDNAERAAKAAFELLSAVSELGASRGRDITLKIGIATGEVLVGDLTVSKTLELQAAIGATPARAEALHQHAAAGTVLIDALTHRLIGERFTYQCLAPICNSIEGPLAAWQVLGETPKPNRFLAAHGKNLSPLVGREHEIGLLRDRWDQAKQGEGQVVLLAGESGIGKSRIVHAFCEQIAGERYIRLSHQCSSLSKRRDRTLATLTERLLSLAVRQPVLLVMSDVQWMVPATREWLEVTIDQIQNAPVLIVITFRPEFTPSWFNYSHITALTLNRLSRSQVAALVDGMTGGKTLPGEVLDEISAKSDGVPLFVEELTKMVLESGLLRETTSRYCLPGSLPQLAIPSTLQDSLLARLDRLGSGKEIAQIAAVIGREFSYALLAAVTRLEHDKLQYTLRQLAAGELIYCHGTLPDASYSFKHALVQEAAYNSLLPSRRKALHARIADVLAANFSDMGETAPELLARHYSAAGLDPAAVRF